jgi:hypothetical protein
MVGFGVPAGAKYPFQAVMTNPGTVRPIDVGELRDALAVGQGEQPHASGVNGFNDVGNVSEEHLHGSRKQRQDRSGRALIRHGDHVEPRPRSESRRHQMAAGSDSAGPIIELPRIGFGISNELRHRMDRQIDTDGERQPLSAMTLIGVKS